MSDPQLDKLYESMTDDDLASFWNHSGMTDDMGELEEELMVRGFEGLAAVLLGERTTVTELHFPHTHKRCSGNGAVSISG
jgi:hypothetical protein